MPTITVTPTPSATYTFVNFVTFVEDLLDEGLVTPGTSTSFESNWTDPIFGTYIRV